MNENSNPAARSTVWNFFFICILSPLHFTNTEWGPGMLTVMYQNIIARFRTSNIKKEKKYRSKITLEKLDYFSFFSLTNFYFIYGRCICVYKYRVNTCTSFEIMLRKFLMFNGQEDQFVHAKTFHLPSHARLENALIIKLHAVHIAHFLIICTVHYPIYFYYTFHICACTNKCSKQHNVLL